MVINYVGSSNFIATNGNNPGAITPATGTGIGSLMVFYHYSRATGGNETVTLPTGFGTVINTLVTNNGLVAVGSRIFQSGDTTFTASITNHTSGTSGETVVEWIETYSGTDQTTPIGGVTASLSTWASSLNVGPITPPANAGSVIANGDWVVVYGGRYENIATQTTLSGNNLTWTQRTLNNTSQGLDAAGITQTGNNASGASQTITSKTITTTGAAQAGGGLMFIIKNASAGVARRVFNIS